MKALWHVLDERFIVLGTAYSVVYSDSPRHLTSQAWIMRMNCVTPCGGASYHLIAGLIILWVDSVSNCQIRHPISDQTVRSIYFEP